MSVSTSSPRPDTSSATTPSDSVTLIGSDYRVTAVPTIANDGISTYASFRSAVFSIYIGIAAAPSGTLSFHYTPLTLKGLVYG
ncbi:hypothetical protein [Kaistia adipata]|uniref:hypothetical protein n=1 Tax=Kaistia adipata TaxID=166954 RepID=UPI0012ECB090|nr:hypothetical protein [Kaistia adipata]